jgi:hypothetical protein
VALLCSGNRGSIHFLLAGRLGVCCEDWRRQWLILWGGGETGPCEVSGKLNCATCPAGFFSGHSWCARMRAMPFPHEKSEVATITLSRFEMRSWESKVAGRMWHKFSCMAGVAFSTVFLRQSWVFSRTAKLFTAAYLPPCPVCAKHEEKAQCFYVLSHGLFRVTHMLWPGKCFNSPCLKTRKSALYLIFPSFLFLKAKTPICSSYF